MVVFTLYHLLIASSSEESHCDKLVIEGDRGLQVPPCPIRSGAVVRGEAPSLQPGRMSSAVLQPGSRGPWPHKASVSDLCMNFSGHFRGL